MSEDFISRMFESIPDQWVGILAVLIILVFALTHVAGKREDIAKLLPFGRIYHAWKQKQDKALTPQQISSIYETARKSMIEEENVILQNFETRISALARNSENQAREMGEQAKEMRALQMNLRVFTAWSIYDGRWHHKQQLLVAEGNVEALRRLRHYDFFEFEKIYSVDPYQAALLSQDLGVIGDETGPVSPAT